jgi:hypothetical protein
LDTNEADSCSGALAEEALFTEDIAKIESLRNLTNCLVIVGDRLYIIFQKGKKKKKKEEEEEEKRKKEEEEEANLGFSLIK